MIVSCTSKRLEKTNEVDAISSNTHESGDGGQESNECVNGEKRPCHITLSTHNGVMNCFVGFQQCENNEWSNCTESE